MNPARVHNDRAELLLDLGRPADAEREAREALADDPENARAHLLLGRALADQRDVEGALDAVNRYIELRPDDWVGHWTAGVILYGADRDREALTALRGALTHGPDEPDVHRMLAWAHYDLDEEKQARAAAEHGVSLAPDDAELAAVLALTLTLHDRERARDHAQRALRLAPESPSVRRWYAVAMLETGDRRTAARAFRESLSLDPGWAEGPSLIMEAERRRNPLDALHRLLRPLRQARRSRIALWLALSLVAPCLLLNLLFTFLNWVNWTIQAVLSLRLSRDPDLRPLMPATEVRAAGVAAAALVLGSAMLAAPFVLRDPSAALPALAVLALVTPVQETARLDGRRRTAFFVCTIVLAAAVAVLTPIAYAKPQLDGLAILPVLVALGSTWVAMLLRSR